MKSAEVANTDNFTGDELEVQEATPKDVDDIEIDEDLIEEENHTGRTIRVRRSTSLRTRQRESLTGVSIDLRASPNAKNVESNIPVLENPLTQELKGLAPLK